MTKKKSAKTTKPAKITKSKTSTSKKNKKAPRNSSVLAARSRKGGSMKDRRSEKKGAKNDQARLSLENELMKEVEQEVKATPNAHDDNDEPELGF